MSDSLIKKLQEMSVNQTKYRSTCIFDKEKNFSDKGLHWEALTGYQQLRKLYDGGFLIDGDIQESREIMNKFRVKAIRYDPETSRVLSVKFSRKKI
jgi:hypothetical protein